MRSISLHYKAYTPGDVLVLSPGPGSPGRHHSSRHRSWSLVIGVLWSEGLLLTLGDLVNRKEFALFSGPSIFFTYSRPANRGVGSWYSSNKWKIWW